MTTDVHTIDWASLEHAYGPAIDTPGLLGDLCSADDAKVAAAHSALWASINHQGTVYPATVAAVPALIDAALHAVHRRADLVTWIGALADPASHGRDLPAVQTAVREHAAALAPLLDDEEQEVRAAVVYLAAQTKAVPAADLLALWESEDETDVRVALLFALAGCDAEGSAETLIEAFRDDEPEVRLAAALAMRRAGLLWPDGAAAALVEVYEAEADLDDDWHGEHEPTTELVVDAPEPVREELLTRLLNAASAEVRGTALWITSVLFRERRSARERFMPLPKALLDDPRTRSAAADVIRQAGRRARATATNWPRSRPATRPSRRRRASPRSCTRCRL
ncbi:HEAT repeat domain-containing protein [Catellatospora coxensis]